MQKNVNRTTTTHQPNHKVVQNARTNLPTWWTEQTCVTNSQVAAYKSWLAKCSPQALRFSKSNQYDFDKWSASMCSSLK